jgi:hypothetical protein
MACCHPGPPLTEWRAGRGKRLGKRRKKTARGERGNAVVSLIMAKGNAKKGVGAQDIARKATKR